jgi:hypothetical protein
VDIGLQLTYREALLVDYTLYQITDGDDANDAVAINDWQMTHAFLHHNRHGLNRADRLNDKIFSLCMCYMVLCLMRELNLLPFIPGHSRFSPDYMPRFLFPFIPDHYRP